jgi:ComF family protein
LGNGLIAATIAPACAACEGVLDQPLGGCVCRSCWAAVRPITPPVCDACGDPLARQPPIPPSPSRPLCLACGRQRSTVTRARAIGEYDGALREIVHALKYGGRRSLARPLAARMRDRGADLLAEVDCVVPVPLHWRREYARGFNQARELCRHLGLPVVEALIRARHTRAQVELAADRRRFNVAGVFRARRHWFGAPRIRGMTVLLVDDVSTTGATLDSCAGALKDAGAADVFALTAARVVMRGRGA